MPNTNGCAFLAPDRRIRYRKLSVAAECGASNGTTLRGNFCWEHVCTLASGRCLLTCPMGMPWAAPVLRSWSRDPVIRSMAWETFSVTGSTGPHGRRRGDHPHPSAHFSRHLAHSTIALCTCGAALPVRCRHPCVIEALAACRCVCVRCCCS